VHGNREAPANSRGQRIIGEIWVSAIGLAVGVAGTAYSISQSNAAIDAANSIKPKKFVPIDIGIDPQTGAPIGGVALQALNADKAAYAATDALLDPRLAAGRDFNINDVAGNLQGKESAFVTDPLKAAGLNTSFADTGSLTGEAKSLGKPILALEQRGRNYFQTQLAENPYRTFGIADKLTELKLANTAGLKNYDATVYGSRIGNYNSQIQQSITNNAAGLTALAGTIGTVGQIYQNSPYLRSSLTNFFGGAPYGSNAGDFATPTPYPVG
jgi:hypothetical protein